MKTSFPRPIPTAFAALLSLTLLTAASGLAQSGPGYAVSFDGDDDWVDTQSGIIPASGDFTVECWVYCASPTSSYREILSQGSAGNALYIGTDPANRFRFGDTWGSPGIAFPFGAWHHLALVKSSTNTQFFLDGTNWLSKGSAIANPAPVSGFRLGRQYGDLTEYWPGRIDEVRIWTVARTGAEIMANMSRNLTGSEPGLEAYWRCNESGGTTLNDATGHGHSGTLNNATNWVPSGVPFPPNAATTPAADLGVIGATLTGSVNPRNLSTTAWFEWGTNASYGNLTALTNLPATNTSLSVNLDLNNLTPGLTYHFRIVATNRLGSAIGTDQEFTTLLLPPTIHEWVRAEAISVFETRVYGAVDPNGLV